MYRIFISHSWAYSSDYDKIESFLRQEGIYFYNHSVPKSDPIHTNGTDKQLSDAIEAKIKGCSCVIILAGVYSTYSKWINKKIEMAKKYNKPIIALFLLLNNIKRNLINKIIANLSSTLQTLEKKYLSTQIHLLQFLFPRLNLQHKNSLLIYDRDNIQVLRHLKYFSYLLR